MNSFLSKLKGKSILKSSFTTVIISIPLIVSKSALAMVGVVYSQENASQWQQISKRLANIRIEYCILDTRNWQSQQNLNPLQALFIPNVSKITPNQAQSLEFWLKTGGKIIASGPTGQSSPDEVKKSLENIFGAQWGFPMNRSANLIPSALNRVDQNLLGGTLSGGVIIPQNEEIITQATWSMAGNPPAVVKHNNTTFFGWRWGIDRLSNPEFDTAWLTKALQDHQIKFTVNNQQNPQPCPRAIFPSFKTPAPPNQ